MSSTPWQCNVCGYVHIGDDPPEYCPVCGVDKGAFEKKEVSAAAAASPKAWRCLVCNYIHEGEQPPEKCPVCGAGSDQFQPVSIEEADKTELEPSRAIVIVGAGISGVSAAEAARKVSDTAKITVVGREQELPYYRINLTRYLAGELNDEQLRLHPAQWYQDRDIELVLGVEVTAVDVANKTLSLSNRESLAYDRLILSTGAHSFIPPVEGANKGMVKALRTRKDAEAILDKALPRSSCVVIGGGVLGLETAAALARRGVDVTVMEAFDWLLPRQLNRSAGERLAAHVESLGIRLICGARIKLIEGEKEVTGVVLDSGGSIPAAMVIFAAGVRCNSALARQAALDVNNGILVDNRMLTSHPDIFAAGDVAEHQGVLYGTWMPAQQQGKVAGTNAAGGQAGFTGVARSNILKVLEVDLFSIGEVHPTDGSYQVFEDHDRQRYACFVFKNSNLVGAILMGDTRLSPRLKHLIENRVSCTEILAGADTAGDIRERLSAES